MTKHIHMRLPVAILVVALISLLVRGTALAHGHTLVGDYELVIGFRTEPAVAGELNGLDLRVKHHASGEPVSGLEESLQAAINFGDARLPLTLRPRYGQEGAYTADVLPTVAGDYTFHIFGAINGTPVDVTMTGGPDTFSTVESRASMSFPAPEATPAELAAVAAEARQQAQVALIVGGIGALLGIAGLAVALTMVRGHASRRDLVSQRPT